MLVRARRGAGWGPGNKNKGKGNGAGLARESQRRRVPYYTRTLLVQTHTHDYSQGMCRTMSSRLNNYSLYYPIV